MPGDSDFRILSALAEELKLPLLQIARTSELLGTIDIQHTAEMALKLIDGYVLGLHNQSQSTLELEPVTLSSVLFDTAIALEPIAKRQGYEIRIDVGQKLGPVMGNRQSLHTAFTVLGYELMQTPTEVSKSVITFASHRSKAGYVAGIFTDNSLLTTDAYRRAKSLAGTTRQALPASSASNGAGVLIAESLLQSLASSFKIARHQKQTGLAATLSPSQQLSFV
jgi:hypothetical protein